MNYDNKFANNTTNVVEPTQELWDNGIELRAEARSNVVNGVLQAISEKSLQTENTVAEKVIEIDTKLNRYDNIFTFVVDSQANFEKWLNNVRDNGEDYTSVLVKSGTWTATKGLNLTTAGTKVIEGQAGNKLQFTLTGEEKGIYYDAIPTSPEYRIDGLNVEVSKNSEDNGQCIAYYKCYNLYNCQAVAYNHTLLMYDSVYAYCFNLCERLINCKGIGDVGKDIGSGGEGSNGYGFYECKELSYCYGWGSTINTSYMFTTDHCFFSCNSVFHCKGIMTECYASRSDNSTYACADTPNGGFNDTTEWTP